MTVPGQRKPLRLWPAVVIVILQWLFRFGAPVFKPEATGFAVLSGLAGGLAVLLWWLLLSRAPWPDRLGALLLIPMGVKISHGQPAKLPPIVGDVYCVSKLLWSGPIGADR